jgi:tRNA-2-methylthio-N6-dimethylallyladenosine synthase
MSDTPGAPVQTDDPSALPLKRLFIKTYGCQMNVYDSERMADVLRPLGYAPTDTPEAADLVILNTCHIRERATEKVFSELGVLKKLKQDSGGRMTLAVAGCVAQAEGEEIIRRQPAVDLVLGPQSIHRLPEMVARASRAVGDRLATNFEVFEKFDLLGQSRAVDGPAAFVSVQEGCDKFCTFCVVPYTRGAEFSRPVDQIVAEVRALAGKGVREITLLGQNVNAFHGAPPKASGETAEWGLGRLIRHLALIGGIERIRYTTSHPQDMDEALISAHAQIPQLMPFLHLPVQSGSDRILKAMNRRHSIAHYKDVLYRVKAARPDIAFATDFIVGFPGETESDFEATLALAREFNFAIAYSFNYSRRPGTPASDMALQVPEEVKNERLQRLQAVLFESQTAFNRSKIGHRVPVLITGKGRHEGQIMGRSPWLQSVYTAGPECLIGQIIDIDINHATQNSLSGVRALVQKTTERMETA